FTVQSLDMEQKLPITWRQNVYLIFKEAVNNVARHSGASRVEINLHRADGHFQMVIRDNGRGMNTVRKKTGHGLKNMQMRAQRLNGQLTLQNGEGTEVRLSVKMV
ncbi:MAG: ATP-binding protein, partial [Calditrichaeota bacterium]|nr:ATP-binding protein [Calditrichota bacterium]